MDIDIGMVLNRIRHGAKYRRYDTYENLKNTWEDEAQSLPTEEAIQTAWEEMQKESSTVEIVVPPINQDLADVWEAILAIAAQKGGK